MFFYALPPRCTRQLPQEGCLLALPESLRYSWKLCHYAKGPISEGAVIERSEMTGGVCVRTLSVRSRWSRPAPPKGELLCTAASFAVLPESLRQHPLSHGLRRASSPKGTPFGNAGKFAATAEAVPLGKVA